MQTGLICFEAVAQLHQVPIDSRSLVREYGLTEGEVSIAELLRIAKHQNFKAKHKKMSVEKVTQHYPLPAMVLMNDGTYALLLKANLSDKKLLCFFPNQKTAQELSVEEFSIKATQHWIILSPKLLTPQIKFGFGWFFKEILHYKQVITEVLVGSFVVQLFGLVTPLFTQVIIDKVVVHHSLSTLDVLAAAFLGVTFFEFFLNLARHYIFTHTASKIDAKLGAKLFKHLFGLPFAYFESRKVGTIISRIRELESIREFVTHKSVSLVIDLFFSLVFVVMMALYSVPLTAIVVGCVAIIAILYVVVTPEFRRRLDEKFMAAAQNQSYLVESVTGIQTIKSLAVEGTMQKKWENYLGNYLTANFQLTTMTNWASTVSALAQHLMTLAILYVGVRLVIEGQLTLGQLIAFNMFANQFTNPVLRLVNLWNEFQQALLGVDRLGDILHQPLELQTSQAITLPKLSGSIQFEDLSFRYTPNGLNVIDHVSLEIPAGKMVAFVGPSGCGKSTLTKLIQRLYLPREGAIYIDSIDTRHLHPLWLRYNLGVVLQENYLFSGSIRENIALPRPDAAIEQIIEVAKLAGVHEFITKLPEGYDTLVGERGSTLSGGQKQRIAIARALITQPKILIFDEATSALDYESEAIIRQSLQRIRPGRTIILIAHRLSTVQDCDEIFVFKQGQVIETGNHQTLLKQNGYYAALYAQQEEEVPHAQRLTRV